MLWVRKPSRNSQYDSWLAKFCGVLHNHFVHDVLVGIMLQHVSQLEGHSNSHNAITAHLSALHVVLVRAVVCGTNSNNTTVPACV